MNGYTKLFSQIVTSTIWQQPNNCRVLWITMLALKDEHNICPATVPALADLCKIGIEECEGYLEQFQQPDKYSRSQEYEGRRIQRVEGGWLILNGEKYRNLLRSQERRDYVREKVAEHRARVNKRKQCNRSKPISESDTEADTDTESIAPDGAIASPRARRRTDDGRTKLPADWRPSPNGRDYASDKGLDPESCWHAFADYFAEGRGRNEKRTPDGWERRWRAWCDREATYAGQRSGGAVRPAGHGGGSEAEAFHRAGLRLERARALRGQ